MKYIVRTTFEGELTWEGDAENEKQAEEFADDAISSMETADDYQRCSEFTDQVVELQGPDVSVPHLSERGA
jgi:hypothetical protein